MYETLPEQKSQLEQYMANIAYSWIIFNVNGGNYEEKKSIKCGIGDSANGIYAGWVR